MISHLIVPNNTYTYQDFDRHFRKMYETGKTINLIIYLEKDFNPLKINLFLLMFVLEKHRKNMLKYLKNTYIYFERREIFDYMESFFNMIKPQRPIEVFSC